MDSIIHYTTKNTLDIDFQQDIITNHNDYTHVIEHQLNNTDFKQAAQLVKTLNFIKLFTLLTIIDTVITIIMIILKMNTIITIITSISAFIFIIIIGLLCLYLWSINKNTHNDDSNDMTRIATISEPKLEKHFLLAQERLSRNSTATNWKLYVECFDRITSLEEYYGDNSKNRLNIVNIVCDELSRVK